MSHTASHKSAVFHTHRKFPAVSKQHPVFRMSLTSVGMTKESLVLALPSVYNFFFRWRHHWNVLSWVVSSTSYSKMDQSQLYS